MPTYTLWPTTTRRGGTGFTNVGAGTRHACVNDDSTATYVDWVAPGDGRAAEFTVGGITLPALASNEFIDRVILRVRSRNLTGTWSHRYGVAVVNPDTNREHVVNALVPVDTATAWRTGTFPRNPATGSRWTRAWVNRAGIVVRLRVDPDVTTTARIFDTALRVETRLLGTLTVNDPSQGTGVVSTSRVPITWDYAPAAGGQIPQRWHVKVFTHADASASGFDPDTWPAVWDSGVQRGSEQGVTTGTLPNLGLYRVFVRVAELIADEPAWTAWVANSPGAWFVVLSASPRPLVSASQTEGTVEVVVQGRDNMLFEQDASLEDAAAGVGNWQVGSLCTLSRSTAWAADGVASLAQSASGSGTMIARLGGTTTATRIPVFSAREYQAFATARAATVARSGRIDLAWYDRTGALLSTSSSSTVTIGTGTDAQLSWLGNAPDNAATVSFQLVVLSVASGNVIRWDRLGLHEATGGGPGAWSRGGLIDLSPSTLAETVTWPRATRHYELELSQDQGMTWRRVRRWRDDQRTQVKVWHLQDVLPGQVVFVRARSIWEQGDTIAVGDWSSVATAVPDPQDWWLAVPVAPELSIPLRVQTDDVSDTWQHQLLQPLFSGLAEVAFGARTGWAGEITVEVDDPETLEHLRAIIDAQERCFLVSPATVGGIGLWCVIEQVGIERVSTVGTIPTRRVVLSVREVAPAAMDEF